MANDMTDLSSLMDEVNKEFGQGSVSLLGSTDTLDVEMFPTGSFRLDLALGGGLPSGRIIEISGPESSGKTTIALSAAASAQKQGKAVAFIDAEHALDPIYAKALGVNIDHLLISQPETAQQTLDIMQKLTESGKIGMIILDSVAAMVPRQELEGESGDAHVGLIARLMSQALRRLTGKASRNDVTLVFINQIREKVGVMFGSPETTPGGRALKFYSSVRLDVRRIETVKDKGGEASGNRTRVKVVKNKVAAPYKQAEFEINFGKGISLEKELIEEGSAAGIIVKSGAWYTIDGEQYQGAANAVIALEENPELTEALEKQIWAALNDGEVR